MGHVHGAKTGKEETGMGVIDAYQGRMVTALYLYNCRAREKQWRGRKSEIEK